VRCPHLTADNLCAVYEDRPQICRDYAADWLCERIAAADAGRARAAVPGCLRPRRSGAMTFEDLKTLLFARATSA